MLGPLSLIRFKHQMNLTPTYLGHLKCSKCIKILCIAVFLRGSIACKNPPTHDHLMIMPPDSEHQPFLPKLNRQPSKAAILSNLAVFTTTSLLWLAATLL